MTGQVRTGQVKSEQIKAGLVQLGLVNSGQIWGVLTLLLEIVVCCRLGCVNIVMTSKCLSEGSQLVTGVN